MAFSDLILRLGNQAKQLEATASTLHTDNDAELKARETELRDSLAKVKSAVDQKLEANSEVAANRLSGLQRTLSDGFEAIRTYGITREKLDAEDAIAFAVHALQEAEYYMLAAVAARDDAHPEIDVEAVNVPVPGGIADDDSGAVSSDTAAGTHDATNAAVAVAANESTAKTKVPATSTRKAQSKSPGKAQSKSPGKAQSKRPPE